MAVLAFDAIGNRGAPEPVWRNSYEEGSFEADFWTPVAWPQANRLLRIVNALADLGRSFRQERRAGKRELPALETMIASINPSMTRVLQELLSLGSHNAGAIYPSYDYLAEKTGYGRATVARALQHLVKLGLIELRRRFRRVEQEGEGGLLGLVRRQVSNVYRILDLPERLRKFLPWWLRDEAPPLPDDYVWQQRERATEEERMLARLSREDFAREMPFENRELREAVIGLGRSIDRHASETGTEAPEEPTPPPRRLPDREPVRLPALLRAPPPEYSHYAREVRKYELRQQAELEQSEAQAAELEAMFQELEAEGMTGTRFDNLDLALTRIDERKMRQFRESHDEIETRFDIKILGETDAESDSGSVDISRWRRIGRRVR